MLLTDKYSDKIYGIITCYDRMIIQGYIPNWCHADAMTAYMKLNSIRNRKDSITAVYDYVPLVTVDAKDPLQRFGYVKVEG